jgi:hypothetical protein
LVRLSRNPRPRCLAENPLLRTLAGRVLRAGKDVPQLVAAGVSAYHQHVLHEPLEATRVGDRPSGRRVDRR